MLALSRLSLSGQYTQSLCSPDQSHPTCTFSRDRMPRQLSCARCSTGGSFKQAVPTHMNHAPRMPPGHLQQAQAALAEAGIPLAAGTQALALAAHFYHATPQVSRTDAMRQDRNRIQDELETLSSQLQQERHQTHRLEQELAAILKLPKFHQNRAYQLRKRLRAILAVLEHPQAKETTKLKSVAKLVAGALAGSDDELDPLCD